MRMWVEIKMKKWAEHIIRYLAASWMIFQLTLNFLFFYHCHPPRPNVTEKIVILRGMGSGRVILVVGVDIRGGYLVRNLLPLYRRFGGCGQVAFEERIAVFDSKERGTDVRTIEFNIFDDIRDLRKSWR